MRAVGIVVLVGLETFLADDMLPLIRELGMDFAMRRAEVLSQFWIAVALSKRSPMHARTYAKRRKVRMHIRKIK